MSISKKSVGGFEPREAAGPGPLSGRRLTSDWAALVTGRPWLVVAAFTAITLLALVPLHGIRIEPDGHAVLPEYHPVRVEHRAVIERFGLDELIHVGVIPDGLPTRPRKTDALPGDATVLLGMAVAVTLGRIQQSDRERQIGIDTLEPAAKSALSGELDTLLSGNFVRGTVVGFAGGGLGVLLPIKPGADREAAIERARSDVEAVIAGSAHRALVVGEAVAENRLTALIVEDLMIAFPVVAAIVALCLVVVLGDVVLAAISLACALMSVVWVAGLMAALGTPIYLTSAMIPVALIAVGVCDEIHLLKESARLSRAHPGRSNVACVRGAIRILHRPMLLTSLTTAGAFATLAFSGVYSVQAIGAYTAIGVLMSYAISVSFAPALWVLLPRRHTAWPGPLDHLARRLSGRAGRARRAGRRRAVVAAAAMAGLAFLAADARIEDSWLSNFAPDDPYRQVAQRSAAHFASGGRILLELEGEAPGFWTDAGNVAALGRFVTAIDRLDPHIAILSLSGYVKYADDLRRAKLGESVAAIGVEDALGAFGTPTGWHLARRLVSPDRSATLVQLFLPGSSYGKIDRLLEGARAEFARLWPDGSVLLRSGGNAVVSHAVVDASVRRQLWALPGSLLIVFLMLWFFFCSARDALLSLVPAAITATGTVALIAVSGRDLGVATSTVGAIAVGLTVDFAIHMATRLRRARRRSQTVIDSVVARSAAPILADAAVLGLGFTALLSMPSPALQALGWLFAVALVMGALVTVWLVPAWIAPAPAPLSPRANSGHARSRGSSSSR